MSWKPSALVVAPTPRVVSSFAAAKQHLEDRPCLLISEVRLGEYNGLHLALRAQGPGIPVVLVGEPDLVLQREAAQLGAIYLSHALDAQQLLAVVQPIVEAAIAVGAWERTAAHAAGEPARADLAARGDVSSVSFVSVGRTRLSRTHNPVRS
jgi:FixJ family two-component response regulator